MDRKVDAEGLKRLTEVFRTAGAADPESWARSQLQEGIPQLARFSFTKAAWTGVMEESNTKLVRERGEFSNAESTAPLSQADTAIKNMLDHGVSAETIVDLIRGTQYEAIYNTLCLIDGVFELDTPVSRWGLYTEDENEKPIEKIPSCHESLLSLDPTGREMRPKPRT